MRASRTRTPIEDPVDIYRVQAAIIVMAAARRAKTAHSARVPAMRASRTRTPIEDLVDIYRAQAAVTVMAAAPPPGMGSDARVPAMRASRIRTPILPLVAIIVRGIIPPGTIVQAIIVQGIIPPGTIVQATTVRECVAGIRGAGRVPVPQVGMLRVETRIGRGVGAGIPIGAAIRMQSAGIAGIKPTRRV